MDVAGAGTLGVAVNLQEHLRVKATYESIYGEPFDASADGI